ncbi:hypothetical protein EC988_002759 [Linderina pennispora]|nr:hypothetical protein EC988_002759 [Linderina pennispora]
MEDIDDQAFRFANALARYLETSEVWSQMEARRHSDYSIRTIDALTSANIKTRSLIAALPDIRYPVSVGEQLQAVGMETRLGGMSNLITAIDKYANSALNPDKSRKPGILPFTRTSTGPGTSNANLIHNQRIFSGETGSGKSYFMLEIAAHIIRQHGNGRVIFVRDCNEWVNCKEFYVDGQAVPDWQAKVAYLVQAMFVAFDEDEGFNEILQDVDVVSTTNIRTLARKVAMGLISFCTRRGSFANRNGNTIYLPLKPFFFFDNIDAVFGPDGPLDRDVHIIIHELRSAGFFIVGAPQGNTNRGEYFGSDPLCVPIHIPPRV